jgi:hypothetical protein
MYIGIDNGVSGAIVILDENFKIKHKYTMPVIGTGRKEYDLIKLKNILKNNIKSQVFLERAQPRFRDGSKQAFKTGYGFGAIEGILCALEMSYMVIAPKTWQKKIFEGLASDDTKTASIMFCKRKWPTEDWTPTERSQKPHDGLTDAACIACYGAMYIGGNNG